MPTAAKWVFENTPKMGGATGEAYTNPLLGTGMDPVAVLAREAIQNSADAKEGASKVGLAIRRVTVTAADKRQFIADISLAAMKSRRGHLKLPTHTCLDTLDDDDVPLELLYIEDYGTVGLHGAPFRAKSHFFRLLLSLGDGSKASENSGSGGSYGFGKSVYSSNSGIHTLIAYSVFDPALSGTMPANHARLMGCAYFNAHEHGGVDFSGRAWFGLPEDGAASPLVDTGAHRLAERLGFTPRSMEDRGTSLLIVNSAVDPDLLRESIEEWWWPRLLDDEVGLDIALFDEGEPLPPPRPRKRRDLQPFIECFDLALGRSVALGNHQKADAVNRLHGKDLGEYGFTTVPDETDIDPRLQEKVGRVALVRAPRMVIEYLPVGGNLPVNCVGTFVAASVIDDYLKRSEPASHDKWDPRSSRLSELGPEAREAVDAVLKRLKAALRRFAAAAMPPAPLQELRLRALEKLLGSTFRPPTKGHGGPGGVPGDPISLTFSKQPTVVVKNGMIATEGAFKLALTEEATRGARVSVVVTCLVQEDETVSREDPIPVNLRRTGHAATSSDGRLIVELEDDSHLAFSFESDSYDPDWTTQVQVSVEEIDA